MTSGSDYLFCTLCGSMLAFESAAFVACPLCKGRRTTTDFQSKETWCTITAQDLARSLGIEPLILPEIEVKSAKAAEDGPKKAVVNEDCPKCKNPQLEYYTRQLRSADEGQTVFYECPKCRHKFAQNT